MLIDRLDFNHRIGLVGSGEPDPALNGPRFGHAGVILQRLEEAVGGGGEVLHHHVALDPVVCLGGGGRGEAHLFVAENRVKHKTDSNGSVGKWCCTVGWIDLCLF